MFIGTRPMIGKIPSDTKITFDNISITPRTQVTNLGVTMECHLNYYVHIHEMHRRVMGKLPFLNRVKDKFESEAMKTVVESIALSAVNYCLPVYGTTTGTLLSRVQQLQNFAAKICAGGARRSDNAAPFIAHHEWLKMDRKVIFDVAVHVYKIKNKMSPEWYAQRSLTPQLRSTTSTQTSHTHTKLRTGFSYWYHCVCWVWVHLPEQVSGTRK